MSHVVIDHEYYLNGFANMVPDYTIVNSDSGCIVILEYNPNTGEFVKLHQETYGKSGSRRIVPGQYLATDPKGRSVMIAAIEKAKLVYILNRDVATNITISSPLEAHASNTIVHHIVGLDVGFDNPVFAALEVEYTASDKDPSGEAFRNTDKVSYLFLECSRAKIVFTLLDVNLL